MGGRGVAHRGRLLHVPSQLVCGTPAPFIHHCEQVTVVPHACTRGRSSPGDCCVMCLLPETDDGDNNKLMHARKEYLLRLRRHGQVLQVFR